MSSSPLAPYFNRVPDSVELDAVSADELSRIIEAAKAAEALDLNDLRETCRWAAALREAALDAIKRRA